MYLADTHGSKYSPLDQINGSNFNKLEVAWTLNTQNFGSRPESKLQGAPIAIKGMLYTTAGQAGKAVLAIDGVTGDEFRKVTVPADSPRGGLLGMAAILAMGKPVAFDARADERDTRGFISIITIRPGSG